MITDLLVVLLVVLVCVGFIYFVSKIGNGIDYDEEKSDP